MESLSLWLEWYGIKYGYLFHAEIEIIFLLVLISVYWDFYDCWHTTLGVAILNIIVDITFSLSVYIPVPSFSIIIGPEEK